MKFILKSLGYLLLLLIICLVIIVLIPDSQYKKLAEKAISALTDRNVVINELHTQRNLNPSVELKGISLSNPNWAENTNMISADQLTASVSLAQLIKGQFDLDLSSDTLNIELNKNKQGQVNWQFSSGDDGADDGEHNTQNPSFDSLARFVLKHLNMNDFKLTFTDDQAQAQYELTIKDMEVIETQDGITQSIKLNGAFDNLPISLNGSTGTFSEFGHSKIMPLDLQASVENLTLLLKGKLDAQSQQLNLDSDINLSLPTLTLISHFTGQKLPTDWKDITASGKLISKAGQFSLENLIMNMSGSLGVDIKGSVADLNRLQGVDIDLNATLDSIKGLSAFSNEPLPDLGPLNLNGKVLSSNEKLSLSVADLSYKGEYGAANISGNIADLVKVDQVHLTAAIELPNLEIAKLFTQSNIPELGPIKLNADIVSPQALDLSANNIKLDYDHDGITLGSSGSINSLLKKGGELNLDIVATLQSLASLNELVGKELPAIGPLDASTNVTGTLKEIRVNQTTVQFEDKFLTGSVNGQIGSINKLDNIAVKANLDSISIGELLQKLDVDSTAKTPATLQASIDKQDQGIKISAFDLSMQENKIKGELNLENILADEKRHKFAGKLDIVNLNLEDVLASQPADNTSSTTSSDEPAGLVLPDSPLPLDFIRDNDMDLTINVGKFETSFISLTDATINFLADQGNLTIGPVKTTLNGGNFDLQASIDSNANPPTSSFNTKIDGFSFKQAGTFKDSDLLEDSGTANASLNISASGGSIAAMLANTNGDGYVDIKNLAIKNDLIKFVSGDLVSEAAAKLNPLEQDKDTTKINCSAVKLDIKDGLAKAPNGYIADAEAFTITGKAEVNFKNQGLDIEVNTNPKEGLGLGLGELAKAIKIEGTIEKPKIGLNPEGVAEIGASIGAAVATGGVSLLAQGQIQKLKADSESCAKVLQ